MKKVLGFAPKAPSEVPKAWRILIGQSHALQAFKTSSVYCSIATTWRNTPTTCESCVSTWSVYLILILHMNSKLPTGESLDLMELEVDQATSRYSTVLNSRGKSICSKPLSIWNEERRMLMPHGFCGTTAIRVSTPFTRGVCPSLLTT